jgi:hypothetical protein
MPVFPLVMFAVVATKQYHDQWSYHSENTAGFLPLPPGIPVGVVVMSYGGVVSLTVTHTTVGCSGSD